LIRVYIAGKDRTALVSPDTISITDSLKIKTDSLSFEMVIESQKAPRPKAGNSVRVIDEDDAYPLFAGTIMNVGQKMLNPITFHFTVEAADYTRFFDRRVVSKKFPKDSTVNEVVLEIIDKWTVGFTKKNVKYSAIRLPELAFDNATPSACLDEVAEKIGWQWYVDFNKDVHFFESEEAKPPALISTNNCYDLDTEIDAGGDVEISEDVGNLKNFIILKDVKTKSKFAIWDSFLETAKMFFTFKWDVFTPTVIDRDSIKEYLTGKIVDNNTGAFIDKLEFRIDNVDGNIESKIGADNTIFVNFEYMGFRTSDKLAQRLQDNPSYRLDLNYSPAEDVELPFLEPDSILEMQEREGGDSSGIYEYVCSEPTLWTETGEEASGIAEQVLARDAWPSFSGSFKSYKKGWKAGQHFTLKSERWGDANEPLEEEVWIQKVSLSVLPEGVLESSISFSKSKYGE
jgi:hypothetical protein